MNYKNLNYVFNIDHASAHVSMAADGTFNSSIPSHSHGKNCYEIHYIISGSGMVIINGISHILAKDMLYVTGPHIVHEQIPSAHDPMAEYCIYLRLFRENKKLYDKCFVLPLFEAQAFWIGYDTQNIRSVMGQIFSELEQKSFGHLTLISALFQQLIIYVVRNYTINSPVQPIQEFSSIGLTSLLSLEEAFLYDYKDITLEQLAKRINVSTRQVQRLLKQYYNSTFQKKRTEARMSAASVLLKSSSYSIAYISEMIGYSTSEHFSNAFKKYFGVSASIYRKKGKSM